MPIAAAAITPVATQPTSFSRRGSTKAPMTSRREARRSIIAITGTATTPLTTALQNSALTGSSGLKLRSAPIAVAAVITP